jgi:hypothetical protein
MLEDNSSPTITRTKFSQNSSQNLHISSGCSPDVNPPSGEENSFISLGQVPYYDLYNANGTIINAANNYWGETPPIAYQIYNAGYTPYAFRDPLPKREIPGGLQLAEELSLASVYPNPFNPTATISFNLNSPQAVSVIIYNIMGQKIRNLSEGFRPAGTVTISWDGKDSGGNQVSSGIYFCSIQTETKQQTVKMTMLK